MKEIVGVALSRFHDSEDQFEFLISYADGREIGHEVSRRAALAIHKELSESLDLHATTPPPSSHVTPPFLSTEDGEFNGNEQPEPDLSTLEEIKYLACIAGAPGHMPVPKALARILTLCNRAGVTKKLDELRPLFATTEGKDDG